LAHGLFSDSSFDVEQADALRRLGHEVVPVDLRGHGRAAKPIYPSAYTFAGLADDVADAVGDRAVVAMGASLGAAAAVAFARGYPRQCRALILLHPAFLYGPRTELAEVAAAARRRGLAHVWGRITRHDQEALRRVVAQDEDAVLAAVEGLAADALLDGPADLAAVAQPTLIVALPGDLLHPGEIAEAYWRHIPTSRLIAETPGDDLLWDRPDDLAMQVDRFLTEVLS